MIAVIVFCAILILIFLEIIHRRRIFSIRDQIGIPGPKPNLITGNLESYMAPIRKGGPEASPYTYPNFIKEYGRTCGLYFGTQLEIMTVEPDIIKEVFISQFSNFVARKELAINTVYPLVDGILAVDHIGRLGAGWKEMRSVISTIFTSGKMKKMHLMFHDQLENLMEVLDEKSQINDGILDIYGEYQAMTMDMIARCALGQQISCIKERENEYYRMARGFISNIGFSKSLVFRTSLFIPQVAHLRRFSAFGRPEAVLTKDLSTKITQRQQERKEGKIRSLPDVIDLILIENEKRIEKGEVPLHHDVIVSNAWALFVAGYETTSTALAFASYLLAKHHDVQDQLREEVDSAFAPGETIEYDKVMKLPYLHAVFCEVLRIYPPVVTFTARKCIKETVIGGKWKIPVGVNVMAPVHAIHWSEQNYERPMEFLPERFLSDVKPSWTPAYMPFGIGPRNCVGARFAEMEFKTVLTEVTRRFFTELDPAHKELKTIHASVLHGPIDNVLYVKLTKR